MTVGLLLFGVILALVLSGIAALLTCYGLGESGEALRLARQLGEREPAE